jgi:glycosyltransferase involved in cell wall biosynthesis
VSALRFCFLTTFYPPYNFGGDGVAVRRLAEALTRRGHHVTVVHDVDAYEALNAQSRPAAVPEVPSKVDVIPLRSGFGSLSPLLTQQFGRPVLQSRRLRRLLADGRFDVVTFHNISLIGGPGILAYGGHAVTIYMAHEHWLVCPTHVLWRHNREPCEGRECLRCVLRYHRPPQVWRATGYLERQLRHVDAFVALSRFSREKHREFGFPREMEVLPHFLPLPAPPPADERSPHSRPYFLFVGRLERLKGLEDVIPAFAPYEGADLVIVGEGTDEHRLRRLAAGNPRVLFKGRASGAELDRYYRHAVALIVPSRGFETFGIVVIEAFRHGTPVLARRIGALPELVDASGGGELFDTAAELTAGMNWLQTDPERRARLSANAVAAFHERWSESAVVPQYLEIVRSASERRSRGPAFPAEALTA